HFLDDLGRINVVVLQGSDMRLYLRLQELIYHLEDQPFVLGRFRSLNNRVHQSLPSACCAQRIRQGARILSIEIENGIANVFGSPARDSAIGIVEELCDNLAIAQRSIRTTDPRTIRAGFIEVLLRSPFRPYGLSA